MIEVIVTIILCSIGFYAGYLIGWYLGYKEYKQRYLNQIIDQNIHGFSVSDSNGARIDPLRFTNVKKEDT